VVQLISLAASMRFNHFWKIFAKNMQPHSNLMPLQKWHRFTIKGCAAALLALGLSSAATADDAPWMDTSLSPDARADLLAAAMTMDQKLVLFEPGGSAPSAIPELGIPARREIDGPSGVVSAGVPTTAFPAPIALAATWNLDLARSMGQQVGTEVWNLGFGGWAAPTLDINRSPYNGRQWASYGEDPLLSAEMATAVVQGAQTQPGVWSLIKHYAGNNQETGRPVLNAKIDPRTLRETYLRPWEVVVQKGQPGAVMCAFNSVNDTSACSNSSLLWDILKGELDYRGWVSSDYDACKDIRAYESGSDVCGPSSGFAGDYIVSALQDGDLSQQRFDDMVHRILRTYFRLGVIDNPPPGSLVNPKPSASPLPEAVIASGDELAYQVAVQGAVLLKNTRRALPLDTANLKSVALIGESADRFITGFGSDMVTSPTRLTTVLDGLTSRLGSSVKIAHVDGADPARPGDNLPGNAPIPSAVLVPASGEGHGLTAEYFANTSLSGTAVETRIDDQVNVGYALTAVFGLFGYEPSPTPKLPSALLALDSSMRWTGSLVPQETGPYTIGATHLGPVKLWIDGNLVIDATNVEIGSSTVDLELTAGQSYALKLEYIANVDGQCCAATNRLGPAVRLGWIPPSAKASPQIQEAVAAAKSADIAIVIAADYLGESIDRGSLDLPQNQNALIEAVAAANPNTIVVLTTGAAVSMPWLDDVAAVVEAWYPGQAQGRAIAALLTGDENFTGELPISWPAAEVDVQDALGIENPWPQVTSYGFDLPYDEGVFIGYRGFDQAQVAPLFDFGYGLSYSRFDYGRLRVVDPRARDASGPETDRDGAVRVNVRNRSDRAGTEIVQIYNGQLPTNRAETPQRQLLGWARVTVDPRSTTKVKIPVELYTPEHKLAYWDTDWGYWITPTGSTTLEATPDSGQRPVTATLTVREPRSAQP